ncbi:MAG: peptide chain release factor 1, partial [Planctomycetota bacterium]
MVEGGLPAILARFRELSASLADPEVAGAPSRLREVLKERGRLARPAELFQEWLDTRQAIRDTERLAADPEMSALAEEELGKLRSRLAGLTEKLADELASDEADRAESVIMEVRPGIGGDEAALFARDLLEMYRRFAESHRLRFDLLELQATDLGGIREAIFSVSGPDVYRMLKFESGVHRVQRVPTTEAQGRLHTSAATVAVLPEVQEVDVVIRPEDVQIDTMRAGGPGGQKVNKTESAVRVTHVPTGIVVKCQDEKSQHKNKARALRILQARVQEKLRQDRARERAAARKSQIGTGVRSERIRSYNFPQDRLTDHRLDFNLHDLPNVMLGRLDPLVEAVRAKEREERLEALDLRELE